MSAKNLRDQVPGHNFDEVTARPRPIADDLAREDQDVGLSVDPEDLGGWALRSAMQEDVAHSRARSEPLSITDSPPSDAALPGPNFNSIDGIWGQSVDAALLAGGLDETRDSMQFDSDDEDDDRTGNWDNDGPELDFRQDRVLEASLLDEPTGEGTETIEPRIRDDANESRLSDHDAEAPARPTTYSDVYRVAPEQPTAAKPRQPAPRRPAPRKPAPRKPAPRKPVAAAKPAKPTKRTTVAKARKPGQQPTAAKTTKPAKRTPKAAPKTAKAKRSATRAKSKASSTRRAAPKKSRTVTKARAKPTKRAKSRR